MDWSANGQNYEQTDIVWKSTQFQDKAIFLKTSCTLPKLPSFTCQGTDDKFHKGRKAIKVTLVIHFRDSTEAAVW